MILDIDPKVDFAFKYMLGKESTRPILIDLANNVLGLSPGHQLQDIELLNPYNLKETPDDKVSIVDIKARDQAGRLFNVEMQMRVRQILRQADTVLWVQAASTTVARRGRLLAVATDHFDQLPERRVVSPGAGLPPTISALGGMPSPPLE